MNIQPHFLPSAVCFLAFFSFSVLAQNNKIAAVQPSPALDVSANAETTLTAEVTMLRKSLQNLNNRLREISDKISAAETTDLKSKQNKILLGFDILSRAEQRAETMRRQFFEMSEKETAIKTRLIQLEEQMRPESLERSTSLEGSTRVPELRDNRRRSLEFERNNLSNLFNQVQQSRARLENDVQDADALVSKLRRQLIPAIEREIPNFTDQK
jgi:septal ring factor EnvC (AmiA/AmiB activator)